MSDTSYLCTVKQVADGELKAESAKFDAQWTFDELIPSVSANIVELKHTEFEPLLETLTITPDISNRTPNYKILTLPMPFMELISVTNGDDELTLDEDVRPYRFNGVRPVRQLELLKSRHLWHRTGCHCSTDPYQVEVRAWWGYRERFVKYGWRKVDVLSAGMDDETDTLTLTKSVDDPGFDKKSFLFSPGNLFKIDSELMRGYDDDGTHEVNVLRGQRGTDPETHEANADVYIWSVEPQVIRAAERYTTMMYARRGVFESATITDVGILRVETDVPKDVRRLLKGIKFS